MNSQTKKQEEKQMRAWYPGLFDEANLEANRAALAGIRSAAAEIDASDDEDAPSQPRLISD